MGLSISNKEINSISIIDDEKFAREGYELSIEDLNIEPVPINGPLNDIEAFANETTERSQAAICDHHLTVQNYASFNGAELVAKWYLRKFPAILCTKWEEASIDEMRRYRKHIPVLVKPDELDPDVIVKGIERCIEEFNEKFQPSRRAWRTLVRVEDFDNKTNPNNPFVYVVLPAWNSNEVIRLMALDLPDEIRKKIDINARFHAHVNMGAERQEDLYFAEWEVD